MSWDDLLIDIASMSTGSQKRKERKNASQMANCPECENLIRNKDGDCERYQVMSLNGVKTHLQHRFVCDVCDKIFYCTKFIPCVQGCKDYPTDARDMLYHVDILQVVSNWLSLGRGCKEIVSELRNLYALKVTDAMVQRMLAIVREEV